MNSPSTPTALPGGRSPRPACPVRGLEGWALYAERLMGELGYLDDPGAYLGMLDSQQLLAVQVPLDIGMHLELDVPRGAGWREGGCHGTSRSSLQPQGLSRQGAQPGRDGS